MRIEKFTVTEHDTGKKHFGFTFFGNVYGKETIEGVDYGPFENENFRDAVATRVLQGQEMREHNYTPDVPPLIDEWGFINYK